MQRDISLKFRGTVTHMGDKFATVSVLREDNQERFFSKMDATFLQANGINKGDEFTLTVVGKMCVKKIAPRKLTKAHVKNVRRKVASVFDGWKPKFS